MYEKLTKCPNFTRFLCEKSSKYPNFLWYLPEKLTKFSNFTILSENARIIHNFPKNIFPDFFFGGGGMCPLAPLLLVSYPYDGVYTLSVKTCTKIPTDSLWQLALSWCDSSVAQLFKTWLAFSVKTGRSRTAKQTRSSSYVAIVKFCLPIGLM